jgi:predicted esterase
MVMKHKFAAILVCFYLSVSITVGLDKSHIVHDEQQISAVPQDTVSEFIGLLTSLSLNSDNIFFKQHCVSILKVLQAHELSEYEISFVKKMFIAFSDTTVPWNACTLSSYTERKRPFIVSWTSPADSVVSLAWLLFPENWNPEQSYPLYVTLHGLSAPYANPVEYLARYLSPELAVDKSFEDGYSLFPWGRGNLWYEGIGETDVWESMAVTESMIKVNQTRKYLVGMSMGGYGAWVIGQKSVATWAALGIYAGALWYNNSTYVTASVAQNLKNVPVYFICGTQDGLLSVNQTAYQLLQEAGNTNLAFETFVGGHEALLENWQKMYEWVRNFSNNGGGTVVRDDSQIPARMTVLSNYPNPFNPETIIRYQLSASIHVKLTVFDLLGREIATVVNKEQNAGTYEVKFNGSNVTSGIYLYQLIAGSFIQTRKMVYLK